jgi:hypothetical protein
MVEEDEPWCNLGFEEAPAAFESASQTAKARSGLGRWADHN